MVEGHAISEVEKGSAVLLKPAERAIREEVDV